MNRLADAALAAACWAAALLAAAGLGWILVDVFLRGAGELSWDYLTAAPLASGKAGGVGPVVLSTLGTLLVCLLASVPLALATAILLAEYAREEEAFGRAVRLGLDLLASMPSIVFGLFGNACFCIALGMGYSIMAGGLTLACMVLPIMIRAAEIGLRAVPDEVRLAAAALGFTRARLLRSVLLPAAAPALGAGLLLGVARALAETAALIFTSGYVSRAPRSLFDSGRTLSIHVYDLAMNVPGGEPRAYAAALVLVGLLTTASLLTHGAMAWLGRDA